MKIQEWLQQGPEVARLDKERILCYNMKIGRAELVLRAETELDEKTKKWADAMLARRRTGEPLAYILGNAEFFGREFAVSPAVLIPRPETEELTAWALELARAHGWRRVWDVGTGSGVIAVTLKLEEPELAVVASDISAGALAIARANARRLGAEVEFSRGDLLGADLGGGAGRDDPAPDLIVANLPYVDKNWEWVSPELRFEPAEALFAPDRGLAVVKKLARQARERYPEVTLLLETDPCQQAELMKFAATLGYRAERRGFGVKLER